MFNPPVRSPAIRGDNFAAYSSQVMELGSIYQDPLCTLKQMYLWS